MCLRGDGKRYSAYWEPAVRQNVSRLASRHIVLAAQPTSTQWFSWKLEIVLSLWQYEIHAGR